MLQMKKMSDCRSLYNGVRIPCVGYLVREEPSCELLKYAIRCGCRRFHLTSVREAERMASAIAESGIGRSSLFLGVTVHEREESGAVLRTLKTDYLDYLLIDAVPLDCTALWDVWSAAERCYRGGFLRSLGLRCEGIGTACALTERSVISPMVLRDSRCLHRREEKALAAWCRARGIVYEALTASEENLTHDHTLCEIATGYGCSLCELNVRCLLQCGSICLLDRPTERQIASMDGLNRFTLSARDLEHVACRLAQHCASAGKGDADCPTKS